MDISPTSDVKAIARAMKAAQDQAHQIEPLTSRLSGFDVDSAYAVAHLIHQARLREGAVAYLVVLLRDRVPGAITLLDSSANQTHWARPFGSRQFDSLLLRRKFRELSIGDRSMLGAWRRAFGYDGFSCCQFWHLPTRFSHWRWVHMRPNISFNSDVRGGASPSPWSPVSFVR